MKALCGDSVRILIDRFASACFITLMSLIANLSPGGQLLSR